MTGVRIDKWLWAARCYKTRAKAKEAIDGGKVEVNGDRTKPSKEIKVGDTVRYRAGYDERTLIVRALSEVRRGAPEAAAASASSWLVLCSAAAKAAGDCT